MDDQERLAADRQKAQYQKMTETPIAPLVIKLGIPTTISMLVTSIYNMADTFFIGRYGAGIVDSGTADYEAASTSASGAVGVVFGLMAIIQAFGFMYGQGSGSISSRALGAKDVARASKFSSTGFFAALLTGGLMTVLGLVYLDPLMRLLGSTETILPYARTYGYFILLAAPFMCSSCVLNNVLRFEGQALFSMVGLASGGIINIFGDWLLMSQFHMGIRGAGISTAVSQTISFGLLLSMFLRGKTSGKLALSNVSNDLSDLMLICKTGLPSLVRQGLTSISTMLLNDRAGLYGDAAVAAMSIVNRICFFTFATALGIGQGFQPVCAFNYGAKKYGRVREAFLFTFLAGEVFLGVVALAGIRFTEPLVRIFRNDPDVVRIGAIALMAQFVGQVFQPLSVCTNMLFQSVGKVAIATLMSMLRSGLFFLPVLLITSQYFGLRGIQLSQGIADVLTFFVAMPFVIRFLREMKLLEEQAKEHETA
ncbi:MAG: MATE family efflux transporter [Lachnospiraceae bacterium]|nr:MATE family efflux transporter [Lachnospiraceae bacterium]